MALTNRTQVLFEPGEHARLKALAQQRGTSIGALVRLAVREKYFVDHQRERLEIAERLFAAELPMDDWDVIAREIEEDKLAGLP